MLKKIYRVISILLVIVGLYGMLSVYTVVGDLAFAIIGTAFFTSGWIGFILAENNKQ